MLGIVSFFTDISSAMIFPLIPTFLIETLKASPILLGTIEGVAESSMSILKVVFGYYSDKLEKRKIFATAGYTTSALGKMLLAISATWTGVLFSRTLDKLGKTIRTAPRDAIIVESVDKSRKGAAFGLHRALDTLGSVLGVAIAAYVLWQSPDNIRLVFYWAVIPAVISVTVMFVVVRDKKRVSTDPVKEKPKLNLKWSVLPRDLKIFLGISFVFALGNSSTLFLILKAGDMGFLPLYIVLLYGVYNVSHALLSYPASKLSDRIGRKNLLVAGYFLFGIVYLTFALVESASLLWLLFAVFGLYAGLTDGVEKAYISDVAPPEIRATALGMHATVVGVMTLPASVFAGWLWEVVGSSTPFYFSAITAFVATILVSTYVYSFQQRT